MQFPKENGWFTGNAHTFHLVAKAGLLQFWIDYKKSTAFSEF